MGIPATVRLIGTAAFAALLALPAWGANESGKPGTTVKSSADTTKAARCAELRKKIHDYEAAKAKAAPGAKLPGSETIKQDISWVQQNC